MEYEPTNYHNITVEYSLAKKYNHTMESNKKFLV